MTPSPAKLADKSSEPFHNGQRELLVAADQRGQILRIQLLGQLRISDHVNEHDRKVAPFGRNKRVLVGIRLHCIVRRVAKKSSKAVCKKFPDWNNMLDEYGT